MSILSPQSPPLLSPAVVQPLAAQRKLLGYWNGTLSIPGVHDRPVSIHITTQTHTGRLGGTLTTSLDPSILVVFTGKIKTSGKLHVTLNGIHSGGAINGSGSAHVSASGHTMAFSMIFAQGTQGFPGTIALTRASAPTPPSTLPGGGGDEGDVGDDIG